MAMMVFRTCKQVEGGLPRDVQLKMLLNIIFDFAVGLVPFIGDIVDGKYRKHLSTLYKEKPYTNKSTASGLSRQHQKCSPTGKLPS